MNWYKKAKNINKFTSNTVGTPTQFLDALPRDTAKAGIGKLQQKIFQLLENEHELNPVDRDWLLKIYNSYQSPHGKMTRKMAWIVDKIWKKYMEKGSESESESEVK